MIKKVIVTNYLGESIEFELRAPEKTGLFIRSIDGLGPGKASINTTDIASDDGSIFNSARSEQRNIVLTLGCLIADGVTNSIETARQLTYKYFPKKKPLKFYILTDNRELEILGYTESNEPEIFTDDETTQISIICPDPLFYSAGEGGTHTTTFNGVDFLFEFAFDNESVGVPVTIIPGIAKEKQLLVLELPDPEDEEERATIDPTCTYFVPVEGTDYYFDAYVFLPIKNEWKLLGRHMYYQPVIEMGSIEILKERNIFYDGDTETGVIIKIHAIGAAQHITIYNTGTREKMVLDTDKLAALTGSGLGAGDEITISTIKGNKYITLLRNGREYNILNIMDKNADWFQLAKGDNIFTYTATYGSSNLQFKILNQIAFEGV